MKSTLAHFRIGINIAISIVLGFIPPSVHAADQNSNIPLEIKINNTNVIIDTFPASDSTNNDLILWFSSEHGLADSVYGVAKSLSGRLSKNEVWLVDILGSLFLPNQPSSINRVPNDFLYQLVTQVQQKTQKRLFIVSSGKAALLAMRASYLWLQDSLNTDQLGGLVLLYPNLLTKTPEPGRGADYFPVTHAVNVPIFILQPENSPWRWQLSRLQQHLVDAQASPYTALLPNIRDRFFFRPDATVAEQAATQNLAGLIHRSVRYLATHKKQRYAVPQKIVLATELKTTKKQAKLTLYRSHSTPPRLNLTTLHNERGNLRQYRGTVVLVNFWASWCPPCVFEMPSMEKLYLRYSNRNFTILAVNMAEDRATINRFLQNRVNVSFPILLDQHGKALLDWRVFAFPSSFVIGKQGKIRYALFGSIRWDTAEVTEIIDKLLQEPVSTQ